jgi:uncharacterized protein YigE (DUF2233 family)
MRDVVDFPHPEVPTKWASKGWWPRMVSFAAVPLVFGFANAAQAACSTVSFRDQDFTVCQFDTQKDKIELANLDETGTPFGGFTNLQQSLAVQGKVLDFAMNAGMFDKNLKPVGLYVENGKQLKKLNRKNGSGNFHLKPNGVFYLKGTTAGVMESDAYAKANIKPDFATQSGPMLVIDGAVHPKLSPEGTSVKIRNGVGMVDDHTIVFVISNGFVTFHDFASLFLEELNCQNALFLDGSVSSLYSRELQRNDFLARLGPMVTVTQIKP